MLYCSVVPQGATSCSPLALPPTSAPLPSPVSSAPPLPPSNSSYLNPLCPRPTCPAPTHWPPPLPLTPHSPAFPTPCLRPPPNSPVPPPSSLLALRLQYCTGSVRCERTRAYPREKGAAFPDGSQPLFPLFQPLSLTTSAPLHLRPPPFNPQRSTAPAACGASAPARICAKRVPPSQMCSSCLAASSATWKNSRMGGCLLGSCLCEWLIDAGHSVPKEQSGPLAIWKPKHIVFTACGTTRLTSSFLS